MIMFVWGETKTVNSSVKSGIWITDSLMYDIGLRNGDKIVAVNNEDIKYFEEIPKKILFNGGTAIKVNRNQKDTTINIPIKIIGDLVERKRSKTPLMIERMPAIVGAFEPKDTSNAKKAGLQYMDKIVKVDSVPVEFMDEIITYIDAKKKQQINLSVLRNGVPVNLTAVVNENGKLGTPLLLDEQYDSLGVYKLQVTKFGFFQSCPKGVSLAVNSLSDYIDQFKLIFKPSTGAYKGVGGFKSMGSIFSSHHWDWQSFWSITAFFSIILAFMNLLPIPALDGGHVLFTLIEMISGRKPSEKFLEYAQIVGMVLLLSLMLYANGNDWFGWGRNK
jgi:regulator of sigma E protease